MATFNNIKVSVSKTELDNLKAFEERYFKIIFPKDIGLLSSGAPSELNFILADSNRTEIYVEPLR